MNSNVREDRSSHQKRDRPSSLHSTETRSDRVLWNRGGRSRLFWMERRSPLSHQLTRRNRDYTVGMQQVS
ncbi:MAG: hypothetical protein F6K30_12875 [Cyanothece sp. SIO2G6]|nr:hypothetical protein [Cyanothece sp. SIO2G6]